MCVIVDADVAPEFFDKHVLERKLSGKKLIPLALGGGKHKNQLTGNHKERNSGNQKKRRRGNNRIGLIIQEIKRQSPKSLKEYGALQLAREERKLPPVEQCKSNKGDRHILALARVSGSRLLVTGDENLKKDFQSKKIIWPVRWGNGKNDGGKIFPLKRGKDKERQELFETMPACV